MSVQVFSREISFCTEGMRTVDLNSVLVVDSTFVIVTITPLTEPGATDITKEASVRGLQKDSRKASNRREIFISERKGVRVGVLHGVVLWYVERA